MFKVDGVQQSPLTYTEMTFSCCCILRSASATCFSWSCISLPFQFWSQAKKNNDFPSLSSTCSFIGGFWKEIVNSDSLFLKPFCLKMQANQEPMTNRTLKKVTETKISTSLLGSIAVDGRLSLKIWMYFPIWNRHFDTQYFRHVQTRHSLLFYKNTPHDK